MAFKVDNTDDVVYKENNSKWTSKRHSTENQRLSSALSAKRTHNKSASKVSSLHPYKQSENNIRL